LGRDPKGKTLTLADAYGPTSGEEENPEDVPLIQYDEELEMFIATRRGLYEIERFAQALEDEEIAYVLGMKRAQFEELKEHQPEVGLVLRRGKARATLDIASKVIIKARQGDLRAAELYLTTRGKWIKKKAGDTAEQEKLEDILEAIADEDERTHPEGGTP
jgi:hypothetical protein